MIVCLLSSSFTLHYFFILDEQWHWQSVDESVILPMLDVNAKDAKSKLSQLIQKYDVCLTGEGIDYLSKTNSSFLRQLIPKAKIYARVAPKQKESILVQLKRMGYITLMCGDGTNDVGALKQAHVGQFSSFLFFYLSFFLKKERFYSTEFKE